VSLWPERWSGKKEPLEGLKAQGRNHLEFLAAHGVELNAEGREADETSALAKNVELISTSEAARSDAADAARLATNKQESVIDIVEIAQETASLEVAGVPVAIAVDIEDNQATLPNQDIRAALVQPVDAIAPNGNPILSNQMVLTFVRRTSPTWATTSVAIISSSTGYWPKAVLALNCPGRGLSGEEAPSDCDAFALLSKTNGSGVQLWKIQFSSVSGVIGIPALLAERNELPPFTICAVPGWAGGEGLEAAGLSVDTTNSNILPISRWSFVYNRLGTGYFGSQCGFDSQARVVNGDSLYDISGPRGEAWTSFSRGEFSRTGLAVTSVWNPATATINHQLRSTIRTLHPRGAGAIPGPNTQVIEHSLYGDDAMALSLADGINWSIARVQP